MAVHAVIFDLDGTLLDTLGDISRCVNVAVAARGFATAPPDVYRARVGWGLQELVRRSVPTEAATDEALIREIMTDFRAEYARSPVEETMPYPGIVGLLDDLEDAGFRCSVQSNKPHNLTVAAVRETLGLERFIAVEGAREGVPHKPDPTGTIEVLARMGVEAADTAFVGDSEIDMETARAAGCRAVGVSWGFRTAEHIIAAGVDVMCYDTDGLRAFFGLTEAVRN